MSLVLGPIRVPPGGVIHKSAFPNICRFKAGDLDVCSEGGAGGGVTQAASGTHCCPRSRVSLQAEGRGVMEQGATETQLWQSLKQLLWVFGTAAEL